MAWFPAAVRKPIAPGPNDPRIKPRVVILHVAVSEQPSLFGYFNGPSGGVESHFYIRRDGTTEQYRSTDYQADANTDANDFAISVETQGMERGEWTAEQLAAIKALILWCHDTHGIPLVRCPAWDGSGIGYHTLFPGRWDKRGASCPGPERKLQFNQIITPWLTAPQEDDMPTVQELLDAPLGANPADQTQPATLGYSIQIARNYSFYTWQIARQLAAQAGIDVDEQALAAQILAGLEPTVREAVATAAAAGGSPDQIAEAVVAKIGDAITKGA